MQAAGEYHRAVRTNERTNERTYLLNYLLTVGLERSHLLVLSCEDGRNSSDHLVHDLRHADDLVFVIKYRQAEYTLRVIAGLLVDDLIEPRILHINVPQTCAIGN